MCTLIALADSNLSNLLHEVNYTEYVDFFLTENEALRNIEIYGRLAISFMIDSRFFLKQE